MSGRGDEYSGARLIWLTGGAGFGKSAVMQSVVERCTRHTVILGTFFFFRLDSSRNYSEGLIPTLAYQLADAFPAVMNILETVINRDPLISKASLQTQAYGLLVCTLFYVIDTGVTEDGPTLCKVFVINGLDECDDPLKQAALIDVMASILCEHRLPLRFLIASPRSCQ